MRRVLVGIVGGEGKEPKVEKPTPAQQLFQTVTFQGYLGFAHQYCEKVFILSLQYGLVQPTQVLKPKDKHVSSLCRGEQHAWAIKTVRSLIQKMHPTRNYQAVILATPDLTDLLYKECRWNYIPACRPTKALTADQRVVWLAKYSQQKSNNLYLLST